MRPRSILVRSLPVQAGVKQSAGSLRNDTGSTRYEITFGTSRSLLVRLRQFVFYLLVAYVASMTIPVAFYGTRVGLDPSWSYAMNYFPGSDYKYGTDIVF